MGIVLDKLDRAILDRIQNSDCVLLVDLKDEFQEPYHKLHYRLKTLADNGYIKLYRGRNSIKCAPLA
jgi:predicted transcriptional regulator